MPKAKVIKDYHRVLLETAGNVKRAYNDIDVEDSERFIEQNCVIIRMNGEVFCFDLMSVDVSEHLMGFMDNIIGYAQEELHQR